MARCLAGFCGCVADTILMVSRAILFITCVLLGIGQAAWLLLPHKLDEQHLQTPARLYGGYIATGILLAVSLMGIHGAYTRDPRNLKIFALIVAFLALLETTAAYHKYTGRAEERAKFGQNLSSNQSLYAWYQTDANPATTMWDCVQESLECCGLKDRSDWNHVRPSHFDKDVLPGSCCTNLARATSSDGRCHLNDSFKSGCEDQFERYQKRSLTLLVLDALLYMMLGLLAISVTKPRNTHPAASQYTRFDNSVYVRRPAYRPGPNQKPPAYVLPNAPPPSYAMS